MIDRTAFVRATCEKLPALSQWTQWCYGAPSILLYDHEHVISSSRGVQQGDPLGPLYFCCGIAGIVENSTAGWDHRSGRHACLDLGSAVARVPKVGPRVESCKM